MLEEGRATMLPPGEVAKPAGLAPRGFGTTLRMDRWSLAPAITGVLYTVMPDPWWAIPLILIEATGFAALNPALYTIVAAGSPPGRSSTAQGLFGGAGTIGFVAASLIAGYLAEIDLRLPFWFFSAVMLTTLGIGLLIAGRDLLRFGSRPVERGAEATTGA